MKRTIATAKPLYEAVGRNVLVGLQVFFSVIMKLFARRLGESAPGLAPSETGKVRD